MHKQEDHRGREHSICDSALGSPRDFSDLESVCTLRSPYLAPRRSRSPIPKVSSKGSWECDATATYAVLQFCDSATLAAAETVSKEWYDVNKETNGWREIVKTKVAEEDLWRGLALRHGWKDIEADNFRSLHARVERDAITPLRSNWKKINVQNTHRMTVDTDGPQGVYTFQQDNEKIVCGCRDNTIRVYRKQAPNSPLVLKGHTGSVLALAYDDNIGVLVSCSSDDSIRLWDMRNNYKCTQVIRVGGDGHADSTLHVALYNDVILSSSKDASMKLWKVHRGESLTCSLVSTLTGHKSAINAAEFDDQFIVTASGDRDVIVWDRRTNTIKHVLSGHSRGVSCLHYNYPFACTGSSDNTIRIWNVETGKCLRRLYGHTNLVRSVRFNRDIILSGDYDGTVKVWDMRAALLKRDASQGDKNDRFCLRTFPQLHSNRVLRVGIDDFSITSSSQDGTICVMDFVDDARWARGNYGRF